MESEFGQISIAVDGSESVTGVEEAASRLGWDATTGASQHVVGYRVRAVGLSLSALAFFDRGWIVPVSWGNRIPLFFGRDSARFEDRIGRRTLPQATLVAPFATDRATYYTYTEAGATWVDLDSSDETSTAPAAEVSVADGVPTRRARHGVIRACRVRIAPRAGRPGELLVLQGELLIDPHSAQVVRIRAEVVGPNGRPSLGNRLDALLYRPVALIDWRWVPAVQTARQTHWLPAYQRVELVSSAPIAQDLKSAFRVVSHIRALHAKATDDSTAHRDDTGAGEPDTTHVASRDRADTSVLLPGPTLSRASGDSLAKFRGWLVPLGQHAGQRTLGDFASVSSPSVGRLGGARWDLQVERAADLVRFNRIEGAYVGLGAAFRHRDAMAGWILRAEGGYATHERTARGQLAIERLTDASRAGVRLTRRLETTNDFVLPLDSASTLAALLASIDDQDYVDRYAAVAWIDRRLRSGPLGSWHPAPVRLRAEVGLIADRYASAGIREGLIRIDSGFRSNRAVVPGEYLRSALELSLNAATRTSLADPGWGGAFRYERGDAVRGLLWPDEHGEGPTILPDVRATGERQRLGHPLDGVSATPTSPSAHVSYQRVEGRLFGIAGWRRFTLAARADAGMLVGRGRPTQQLFEVGGTSRLAGYDYKHFTGDRAATGVLALLYSVPVLEAPLSLSVPLWRRLLLPSLAPALNVRLESAWVDVSPVLARSHVGWPDATPQNTGGGGRSNIQPLRVAPPVTLRASDGSKHSVELGAVFFGGALSLGAARPLVADGTWRTVVRFGRVF